MKKIKYLVRKRAMGDVLWIEPLIRQLAPRCSRLVVYTKFPELFQNYPLPQVVFKKTLSIPEKILIRIGQVTGSTLFSVNLDNAYEKRPNMHFLHAYQEVARTKKTVEYPKLYLSDAEKADRKIEGKYILLHLESFSDKKFRQVFGVDWEIVVQALQQKGFQVVQIGVNPVLVPGATAVKSSLRELMSLCYHASYFIGIDSGPSHIAAALGIPSLVFFGGVQPHYRHFPELFKGVLAKQPCEYDEDQARVLHEKCLDCQRSPDPSIALCSLYTTDDILSKLTQLMA